eukprot:scaffold10871_cov131-Skeletonema_dohrnii-CCMP3373.AAC.7
MAWRRMERLNKEQQAGGDGQNKVDGCLENNEMKEEVEGDKIAVEKNCTRSVSSSEMSASSEEKEMMTPSRNSDVENDHPETQSNHDAIQIDQGVTVVTQQQQSPRQQNRHHSSIPGIESSSHSAIGHLMDDVRSNLSSLQPTSPLRSIRSSSIISIDNKSSHKSLNNENDNPNNNNSNNSAAALQKAYQTIHTSSLIAILASLTLYTITATCMALFTRGLKDEVVAVIVGFSKFVASVIVFILSAKVPQWVSVEKVVV